MKMRTQFQYVIHACACIVHARLSPVPPASDQDCRQYSITSGRGMYRHMHMLQPYALRLASTNMLMDGMGYVYCNLQAIYIYIYILSNMPPTCGGGLTAILRPPN